MERSSFDVVAELIARDIDRSLLRRGFDLTPDERLVWLEGMQSFADDLRKARDEAARAARSSG